MDIDTAPSINASAYDAKTLIAQTGSDVVFLLSAMAIAFSDRILAGAQVHTKNPH